MPLSGKVPAMRRQGLVLTSLLCALAARGATGAARCNYGTQPGYYDTEDGHTCNCTLPAWRTFNEACPLRQYARDAAAGRPVDALRNEKLLLIGDSTDHLILTDWAQTFPSQKKRLNHYNFVAQFDSGFEAAFFPIFGVGHVPAQPDVARKMALKPSDPLRTADRLGHPLARITGKGFTPTAIVFHSCLWDLSRPLVADHCLTGNYVRGYVDNVLAHLFTLREKFPNARLFLRTSGALTAPKYMEKCTRAESADPYVGTRTRKSQVAINNAMRHVVRLARQAGLQVELLDYYNLVDGRGYLAYDNRHYQGDANIVFFDMLANAIAERPSQM